MAGNNVPGIDSAPQFSTSVPGVALPRRQEFTEEGQTISKVGEQIQNTAHAGNEIADEISRQHDISTSSKNYIDAGVAHAQKLQDLKQTSPDGFIHDPDTGEINTNADGSQRTIAQEYWGWADSDYQSRQDTMPPRAAAMFRQQMQSKIGENTQILQRDQLKLQKDDSERNLNTSIGVMAHDNDRSPWPDQGAYYAQKREDGSINYRGDTQKIQSQLQMIQLTIAQRGPVGGKPGAYTPDEVRALTAQSLSVHSDDWMRSAVTDITENDTPRDHKNKFSTTALQQVLNLRDVVEGADPQSKAAVAMSALTGIRMPTVNNSMDVKQIDKWRNQLNSMLDGARKIDRSEYELALQTMKGATKSGQYATFDTLVKSPEFQHLVHAAEPLGRTPDEQMKDISEIFGNAARTSGHGGLSDLSNDATKRSQIEQNLRSFELGWPQYAAMAGAHFAGGMGNEILGEAGKSAYSQLEEESKQYREDPAKFAAQVSSGPQDPNKGIKYRSSTMHMIDEKLFQDPSEYALTNRLPNGKPLISSAIKEMSRIGAMGFGHGYEPIYLPKDKYESVAKTLEKSNNPERLEDVFQQIKKVAGPNAGTVMDQLVKVGKLDPRYQTAQNLPTPTARIAAYSEIMSKGSAVQTLASSQGKETGETKSVITQKAYKANQAFVDFNNRLYGADSPGAAKNNTALIETWNSAYATSRLGGAGQTDATKAADERVTAQIPTVAPVQDQHHFMGMSFGSAGPASKVQFSRADLSPDQQQTIQANLLKAQKSPVPPGSEIAPAPIKPGDYNFNPKVTPEWIAEHPHVWYPVRQGSPTAAYRLQYQGINADGSPNGRGYDLRLNDLHGEPKYYEVKESDALKKQAK